MKIRESVKRMLIDLIDILPQANAYAKESGKYKEILRFLNSNNYYLNEDMPMPTYKEISNETGLSVEKIRKQIKNLYLDLVDSYNGYSFDFSNIEIVFTAVFLGNFVSIKTKELHVIPRVGESVDVTFFKGKIDATMFYVKEVRHTFINNQHIVDIRLNTGLYNKYSHFRLDKALATGEVGRMEIINSSEFEILRSLGMK